MGFSGDDIDIGVSVHANQDAAQVVDRVQSKLDALRQSLADITKQQAQFDDATGRFRNSSTGRFASLDAARQSATDAASAINTTIGAFTRLGQMVDVTNTQAVRAFRQEGDAVSGYLAKLGATDAELNKIGAAIATVEQRAGKASVALDETVPATLPNKANASVFALRRGADAVTALSFAASTGKVSLQTFSIELGSVTTAAASLSGASLLAATGIGALVSIGLALVGVLSDMRDKAKQAKTGLDDLSGLSASTLRQRAQDADLFATSLEKLKNELLEVRNNIPANDLLTGVAPPNFAEKVSFARSQIKLLSGDLAKAGIDATTILDAFTLKRGIDSAIGDLEKKLDEARKRQLAENAAFVDAQRKADTDLTNQRIKDDQAVVVERLRATQGERAAREQERKFELDNTIADIKTSGARQQAQDQAIAAARAKFAADRAKDDQEFTEQAAQRRLEAELKTSNAIEQKQLSAAKETQDKTDAAAQASRDARQISEQQLIADRLRAQITEINAEEQARLTSIGRQIVAQQKLLDVTVDPEKRQKIVADIQALQDSLTKITQDANGKRVAATTKAGADIAAVQRQLVRTVQEGDIAALQDQGKFVEAAHEQVTREFRDSIQEALALAATGDTTGLTLLAELGRRAGSIIARAAVTEIERDVSVQTTVAEALIERTNILLDAHALTRSEARGRIVQALTQERDAIAASIPLLEEQAKKLPGDTEAQARLEQYRTKLLQLNVAIAQTSDQFFNLKVASVDALQQGLAEGIDETLTSTKDLGKVWASTALSIIQSIQRVISEMLAQLAVEQLLKIVPLFGGTPDLSSPTGFAFNVFRKASGGLISGPGSSTSDSIPAMLSNGEFVLSAAAVRRYGVELLETMNAGLASIRPAPARGFAEGGLVSAVPVSATWRGQSDVRLMLDKGVIAEVMRSTEGQDITFENLRRRGHSVRSLFGRGG